MTDLMICEICGNTFLSNGSDVCGSCRTPVKKVSVKKPSSTLVNAVKRVMKGQVSKSLKVRECGVELDRVISDADEMGERMEDIEINGINIIAHQLESKIQVSYKIDEKVISGYYA